MILVGCSFVGTASAEIEVELLTYITPQDIREDDFDISVCIEAQNIPSSEYPLEIIYFLNDDMIFNRTIDGSSGNFSFNTWFSMEGKPRNLYAKTKVLVLNSTGFLIASPVGFELIHMIDPFKKTAELQLVSMEISRKDKGLFEFFEEDSYQTTFSIKNMNYTFSFKGTIDFGDFRPLGNWQVSKEVILGPGETFEIIGPDMTETDLEDIRTRLCYCAFC